MKQHRRTVALIVAFIVTVPLFMFTSLPPIEVIEEVVEEVPELIEIPVVINQTVEVEVNITEGGSIFLESQPAPPLIDSDIVLCIDISGSMDVNRMPVAKSAITSFLDLLNKSNSAGISDDRVALVTFNASSGDWTTDADNLTTLDFITNQTHLNNIISEVNSLLGSGGTDMWAGLNASLEILLNNPRNEPSLKSIFLLTDGLHQTGPWDDEVQYSNDYNGFMTQPSNVSIDPPYAESPIVVARNNGVKIYSIGLFEGVAFGFDQNFLLNISTNVTHGTFGEFFTGNNTLDLSEGFLQSRDSASGWSMVNSSEILVNNNLTHNLFTFNVTKDIRRLKWDLNWNNTEIDFNLTAIDPNGTVRSISIFSISDDIIPVTLDIPKSVIFDFPTLGEWKFNITCRNSSVSEQIKSRISSFQPPIYIESIIQKNSSEQDIDIQSQVISDSPEITPSFKIFGLSENGTVSDQSVIFLLNVSNKNPIFNYTNITPYVLANFTSYNITSAWNPGNISLLTTGSHTVFQFNLTFNEPAFLQGTIFFKVNCTEGYYDAIAQGVSLDFRINTVTVNQTISTIVLSQGTTIVKKYTYNRQDFDTLKWAGFFITLGLLMSFLGVYVTAQAYRLRSITNKVRSRLFPDRSIIN
ncbi:MAG: vWA domain-containing protein, partial [Candidatus Kariarchaeaceae archaeon]